MKVHILEQFQRGEWVQLAAGAKHWAEDLANTHRRLDSRRCRVREVNANQVDL